MKKQATFMSALLLTASVLFAHPMTTSAAESSADYQLRFVPERNIISAEEIAKGDVTIRAAVYLTGSTANTFGSIELAFDSDDSSIYFRNMVTGDNSSLQDEATTYESSQGTFTTNYVPYCFGYLLGSKNRYMTGGPMITTNQYACDPVYGAELYSAGPNKIQFTADNGTLVTCDVTVDDDGNGHYSYTYTDKSTNQTATKNAVIPRYDATIPAYDKSDPTSSLIPDNCNRVVWLPGSSQLKTGASFFGNTSDEFPFCYVDIVIEKGTTSGIYSIDFDLDKCALYGISHNKYSIESVGTTIAVDVDGITVSSVDMDQAAYYESSDNTPIQAVNFASSILANFTYTDENGKSVTERNIEIVGMVDCDGLTPKQLYDEMAENGCYISDSAPLYCDGEILKQADGTTITQKIMIGTKGDVDYSGTVDIMDAYKVLQYYAKKSAGSTASLYTGSSKDADMETLTYFLADIDTASKNQGADGSEISIMDAYYILQYYSNASVGLSPSWSDFYD